MATTVVRFRNSLDLFSSQVSEVDTILKEIETEVIQLYMSLNSTILTTTAKQICLYTVYSVLIMFIFVVSDANKSDFTVSCAMRTGFCRMFILLVIPLYKPMSSRHLELKWTRNRVGDLLRSFERRISDVNHLRIKYAHYLKDSEELVGVTDELRAKVHGLGHKINRMSRLLSVVRGRDNGVEALRRADRVCMNKFWGIGVGGVLLHVAVSLLFCWGIVFFRV